MKRKYVKNIFVCIILGIAIIVVFAKVLTNTQAKKYKSAYMSFLESKSYKEDFYHPEDVRYELAYIDGDNVPELLLADGNLHVSKVAVYTYNEETKQIGFLATFSSFGKLGYVPKKNIIISYYGNHGYYYTVYSQIAENQVKLRECVLSDGRKEECKCYAGFTVDEAFTGGFGKLNEGEEKLDLLPEGKEEYQITEKAFEKLVGEMEEGKVVVNYESMREL